METRPTERPTQTIAEMALAILANPGVGRVEILGDHDVCVVNAFVNKVHGHGLEINVLFSLHSGLIDRLDGDFHNNVFQHLEPSTEEEAQHSTEITDVHERCAAFPIQRSDDHKNSPVCMYNPMDETSSANKIYVQRRNGSKTSIIESDSGLVKNGNLLQLLKMARTCVFIFHEGQIG